MKELFIELKKQLESNTDIIMATIIASSGSTPRGAGAKMLISKNGWLIGSVGGGAVEFEAINRAKNLLSEKKSFTERFSLTKDQISKLGMVCGGDVAIYYQYISCQDKDFTKLLNNILEYLDNPQESYLLTEITENKNGSMWLVSNKEILENHENIKIPENIKKSHAIFEYNSRKFYIEPLVKGGTVYVFGGGHISRELVPLLTHLDFRVVVVEDREEFAKKEFFPNAADIILGDFNNIFNFINVNPNDYIVIMTRGHENDYVIQKQILKTKPKYIGVIGSKSKVKYISDKLMKDGYTEEEIKSIYTPIGLNIKAETPAEIAVSIASEMILVRAERSF